MIGKDLYDPMLPGLCLWYMALTVVVLATLITALIQGYRRASKVRSSVDTLAGERDPTFVIEINQHSRSRLIRALTGQTEDTPGRGDPLDLEGLPVQEDQGPEPADEGTVAGRPARKAPDPPKRPPDGAPLEDLL